MTKEELRKRIGENIRYERKAKNMTLEELANILDYTPSYISHIEKGKRGVTAHNLSRFAEIFGVSSDYLVNNIPPISLYLSIKYKELKLKKEPKKTIIETRRRKVDKLISNFEEKELDFVIRVIKSMKSLKETPEKE